MPPVNPNVRAAWQIEHVAAINQAQMVAATAIAEANANAAASRGNLIAQIQVYLQGILPAVAANPTAGAQLAAAQALLTQLA